MHKIKNAIKKGNCIVGKLNELLAMTVETVEPDSPGQRSITAEERDALLIKHREILGDDHPGLPDV